jgi:DNA-directed RNA polymerase specialized sigma subunit
MLTKSKPDRDALVVQRRKAGVSMVDIAKEFGISHSRISQICTAAALAESKAATTPKPGQR